eukprot:CAMPEP_0198212692 /NCGR_PEP_ID=MMETSP1445-20131203/27249_1 /TAXON_ID=36898 /ORGANISM="Pyramimonas sp., Strain CCMP2087" /LENGTH=247 /DNA_ID=CAMNT_0043887211 /DNA_START=106 /DNA_END=846 /DNA_ORIENTATION=+
MSAHTLACVTTFGGYEAKVFTTAVRVQRRIASHRTCAPYANTFGTGISTAFSSTVCKAKGARGKDGFGVGDDIIDFIEGGPKMRRWYGQAERGAEEYGDGFGEEEEEEDEDTRPAVLVTDADSEMGQILVLQLILQRQRVKVLVANIEKAKMGFGPYVQPFEGNVENLDSLAAALKNTKMVICCGKVGELPSVASEVPGVEHIVLLSATGITTGKAEPAIGGLFGAFSAQKAERDLLRKGGREAKVA